MSDERSARAARSSSKVIAAQLAVGVAIVATWQALVALDVLDPFFVSRPTDIAGRMASWIAGGTLWRHLAVTLRIFRANPKSMPRSCPSGKWTSTTRLRERGAGAGVARDT